MTSDRKPAVLGKAGVSMIGMGVGWFMHCLVTDARYQAGPSTVYWHGAALIAVILVGFVMDYDG